MNSSTRQAVIHQVDCPGDTLESMDPQRINQGRHSYLVFTFIRFIRMFTLRSRIPVCRSNRFL